MANKDYIRIPKPNKSNMTKLVYRILSRIPWVSVTKYLRMREKLIRAEDHIVKLQKDYFYLLEKSAPWNSDAPGKAWLEVTMSPDYYDKVVRMHYEPKSLHYNIAIPSEVSDKSREGLSFYAIHAIEKGANELAQKEAEVKRKHILKTFYHMYRIEQEKNEY